MMLYVVIIYTPKKLELHPQVPCRSSEVLVCRCNMLQFHVESKCRCSCTPRQSIDQKVPFYGQNRLRSPPFPDCFFPPCNFRCDARMSDRSNNFMPKTFDVCIYIYIYIYTLYIERSKWLKHTSRHLALHPCISSMAPKCNFNASKAAAARGSQSHKLRASKVDELWASTSFARVIRCFKTRSIASSFKPCPWENQFGKVWYNVNHTSFTTNQRGCLSFINRTSMFRTGKDRAKAEPF